MTSQATNTYQADVHLLEASERALATLPQNFSTLENSGSIEVQDPTSERIIATVPNHTVAGALEALRLADAAGKQWAATPPRTRSDVLHAAYALLQENRDRLALVLSRELGKPLAQAYSEVQYANDYVRWNAEEALRASGSHREAPSGGATLMTLRAPVGLSVLITPWNFPIAMITRKVAPALAAGCGAVIKPATLTPLTTYMVISIMEEAGVPEGLVQVITTENASAFSEAVLADERVRKLSFTGSTPVGAKLMQLAAKTIIKSSMELGGNAPLLVFDDADLERAVEGTLLAKMRNGGQACTAANRIMVQEGIADAFVEALTERLSQFVIGNPLNESVTLGPLVDGRATTRIAGLVHDAIAKGADLRLGGAKPEELGHFFEATVLDHVPAAAEISSGEIFGPVAAISRFSNEEQAIAEANNTAFGLCGYLFTENLDRAFNVADRLATGIVGINQGLVSNIAAPFGGVKQSGTGREGGQEGIEEYQEIRYYNLARRAPIG